ncbi:MAG: DUF4242 domain-containing protein [Proteobacteria bacterium]|nr:DUF4242 domain-containing protein [Pseudomonadota bacterium]
MKKYIIERALPGIENSSPDELREAARTSNAVLEELGPEIQWVESYVVNDMTLCVYMARDEDIIREHAEKSGFPATKITEVKTMIGRHNLPVPPHRAGRQRQKGGWQYPRGWPAYRSRDRWPYLDGHLQ